MNVNVLCVFTLISLITAVKCWDDNTEAPDASSDLFAAVETSTGAEGDEVARNAGGDQTSAASSMVNSETTAGAKARDSLAESTTNAASGARSADVTDSDASVTDVGVKKAGGNARSAIDETTTEPDVTVTQKSAGTGARSVESELSSTGAPLVPGEITTAAKAGSAVVDESTVSPLAKSIVDEINKKQVSVTPISGARSAEVESTTASASENKARNALPESTTAESDITTGGARSAESSPTKVATGKGPGVIKSAVTSKPAGGARSADVDETTTSGEATSAVEGSTKVSATKPSGARAAESEETSTNAPEPLVPIKKSAVPVKPLSGGAQSADTTESDESATQATKATTPQKARAAEESEATTVVSKILKATTAQKARSVEEEEATTVAAKITKLPVPEKAIEESTVASGSARSADEVTIAIVPKITKVPKVTTPQKARSVDEEATTVASEIMKLPTTQPSPGGAKNADSESTTTAVTAKTTTKGNLISGARDADIDDSATDASQGETTIASAGTGPAVEQTTEASESPAAEVASEEDAEGSTDAEAGGEPSEAEPSDAKASESQVAETTSEAAKDENEKATTRKPGTAGAEERMVDELFETHQIKIGGKDKMKNKLVIPPSTLHAADKAFAKARNYLHATKHILQQVDQLNDDLAQLDEENVAELREY